MEPPDSTIIEVHGAENRYLQANGWEPTLYQESDGHKPIRVWVKNGRVRTHTVALTIQKKWDAGKWREMDRVAANLLPEKFGSTTTPPTPE